MKRIALLAFCFASACTRDLGVADPPPVTAGAITGHVAYAVPGRTELHVAADAVVSLLGSGLETTTNAGGAFTLEGVEVTDGRLLFRLDTDKDGVVDRQRVLSLADYGTGPHRRVDLGNVTLGENASVHGHVRLADLDGGRSGHAGSAVFVPEGPYAATTADDGSFYIANLPEGSLQFFAFRGGYRPLSLGTVALRSGEDFAFRDVTLQRSSEPQTPGSAVGRLLLVPAAALGDTAISMLPSMGPAVAGVVNGDFTFTFASIDPGLYSVVATRTGYTAAAVNNVLVLPGKETSVGAIALTDRPAIDAGTQPPFDAGSATSMGCGSNAQCPLTDWCDDGLCRRQCASAGDCTNGRACDPATRTCVRLCSAGCGADEVCDSADAGTCRKVCDGAIPCAVGFRCAASRCVPECLVSSDCALAHRTCQAGQCVNDLSCAVDVDCATDRICVAGTCLGRPTSPTDAGTFRCATPCDCRLDEQCSAGECIAAPVPTLYFSATGTGNGRLPRTPSSRLEGFDAGPGGLLALKENDVFTLSAPLALGSGITLAGGYRDCGDRWVHTGLTRSTLTGNLGTLVSVTGSAGVPVIDTRVSDLSLTPQTFVCAAGALTALGTLRLGVARVDARLAPGACGAGTSSVVHCTDCTLLDVDELTLADGAVGGATLGAVSTFASSGKLKGVRNLPTAAVSDYFSLVELNSPSGPWVIDGARLAPVTTTAVARGVVVATARANDIVISNSVLEYPRALAAELVSVSESGHVHVRDNLFDGAQTLLPPNASIAIYLLNSAGDIERNTIVMPRSGMNVAGSGISLTGTGPMAVRDNRVTGGQSAGQVVGIALSGLANGPHELERNVIEVGPGKPVYGLYADNVGATAGLALRDDVLRVWGDGTCGTVVAAAHLQAYTSALFERCRLYASGGGLVFGLAAYNGSSPIEIFASHLWAGETSCVNDSVTALRFQDSSSLFVSGSTLDAEGSATQPGPSLGVNCSNITGLATLESNIISGGRAASRLIASCDPGVNVAYARNYFWYQRPGLEPLAPTDSARFFTTLDGGFDSLGNIVAGNVSPFDAIQPTLADGGVLPAYRLSASSLCLDRGALGQRRDGTFSTLDLDGRPRDGGAGPDIGASER